MGKLKPKNDGNERKSSELKYANRRTKNSKCGLHLGEKEREKERGSEREQACVCLSHIHDLIDGSSLWLQTMVSLARAAVLPIGPFSRQIWL